MKNGYSVFVADGTTDGRMAFLDLETFLTNANLSPKEEKAIKVNIGMIQGDVYDFNTILTEKNAPMLHNELHNYSGPYHCDFPFVCKGHIEIIM